VGCRRIARAPTINYGNPASRSPEDQCCAQASRSPADDHHVVVFGLHQITSVFCDALGANTAAATRPQRHGARALRLRSLATAAPPTHRSCH
jgi:hypothetical protein